MHFKKQVCLFLALFLLVSNSGLAFNLHFCEGKIASVSSIFSMEEVCDTSSSEISKQMPVREEIACCAKPDPKHKKCCSDKEVNLKNKTEKMVFKTITFELDSVFINQVWTSKIYTPAVVNPAFATLDYGCDANTPPLYQLFCQFTLFG